MDFLIILLLIALAIAGLVWAYRADKYRQRAMDGVFAPPRPLPNGMGDPWAPPPPAANSNMPSLAPEQLVVLEAMCADYGATANHLAIATGLPREDVNRIRRELRDLGLARFGPLYDEDGAGVRGSGYTLTLDGLAAQVHYRTRVAA